MEDAHTTLLELEDAKGTAFYAVYDGHGGMAQSGGNGPNSGTFAFVPDFFFNFFRSKRGKVLWRRLA